MAWIFVQVVGVKRQRDPHLFQIIGAVDAFRFLFGVTRRWQKHARENCDDGDHDEEFDESESANSGGVREVYRSLNRIHGSIGEEMFSLGGRLGFCN